MDVALKTTDTSPACGKAAGAARASVRVVPGAAAIERGVTSDRRM